MSNNQCECQNELSGSVMDNHLFQMCDGGEGKSISAVDLANIVDTIVNENAQISRSEGLYVTYIDDMGMTTLVEASPRGEVILDQYEILLGVDEVDMIAEGGWGLESIKILPIETIPPNGYTHAILTIQSSLRNTTLHDDIKLTDEFGNLIMAGNSFERDHSHSNIVTDVKVPLRFNSNIGRYTITLNDIRRKDKVVILTGFSLSEIIDGEVGIALGDDSDVDTEINPVNISYLNHDYNGGGIPTTTIDWRTDPNIDITGGQTYELQIDFGGGNIHLEQVTPIVPVLGTQQAIITWPNTDTFKALTLDARVRTPNHISGIVTSNSGIDSETTATTSITVT